MAGELKDLGIVVGLGLFLLVASTAGLTYGFTYVYYFGW